jgi:hypothetical protein
VDPVTGGASYVSRLMGITAPVEMLDCPGMAFQTDLVSSLNLYLRRFDD